MSSPESSSTQKVRATNEVAWSNFFNSAAGKALELRGVSSKANECQLVAPFVQQARKAGTQQMHPGVLVVLADQCLGTAASGELSRHLVTVDLRLDWFEQRSEQTDIYCHAKTVGTNGRSVFVTGNLTAGAQGPLVANANGQFLLGASAGGFTQQKSRPTIDFANHNWPSYEAFLELKKRPDGGYVLEPGSHRVGSPFLPAIHGGITSSTLQQAMLEEAAHWKPGEHTVLLSLTTQFLNAGAALEPLLIETTWIRRGKSVAVISATATQSGRQGPVAVAQATFITNAD
jgi:acyl-coenzyme A thioesterase PaaI-like protein